MTLHFLAAVALAAVGTALKLAVLEHEVRYRRGCWEAASGGCLFLLQTEWICFIGFCLGFPRPNTPCCVPSMLPPERTPVTGDPPQQPLTHCRFRGRSCRLWLCSSPGLTKSDMRAFGVARRCCPCYHGIRWPVHIRTMSMSLLLDHASATRESWYPLATVPERS